MWETEKCFAHGFWKYGSYCSHCSTFAFPSFLTWYLHHLTKIYPIPANLTSFLQTHNHPWTRTQKKETSPLNKQFCFSTSLWNAAHLIQGFPGSASGKEPTCQCRRHKRRGFNSWVGKVPWRRAGQPTPAFLPVEFNGQMSLVGYSPWGRRAGHNWSDLAHIHARSWCNLWWSSHCSRRITTSSQSRSGAFNTTPLKICLRLFLSVQKNSQMSRLHWTDHRGRPLMLLFTDFYNLRE